ncbi:Sec63 Brl domain-containing protein [Mycena floridula]|nr:Sec63 Brl domain-containing protein [Mycena floridula]
MGTYNYDESGNMAAYFLITFLAVVLIPVTLTISPTRKKSAKGCQCQSCAQNRAYVSKLEGNSWFLKPTKKAVFLVVGWSALAFVSYKVANAKIESTVYDPFEILGLSTGTSEKEIKSTFKKLSRMYHPDKVKATANQTIEMIQDHFVKITKAYKSLTDETIRKNLELYGNPDGRQEMTMGIALPPWVNNIWSLAVYGIIFGVGLPYMVGSWWFGWQSKTKDGIHTLSAAAFFRAISDESTIDEVVGTLGKAYEWDYPVPIRKSDADSIKDLEKQISEAAGPKWNSIKQFAGLEGPEAEKKRRAMVLLYAYLLRLPIPKASLRQEQSELLLQLPLLLNALLSISTAHNWLLPTLAVLRLHSYFAQALLPGNVSGFSRQRFAQLPGIKTDEVEIDGPLAPRAKDYKDFVMALEKSGDGRSIEVKKAVEKWGRLDVVYADFRVIGERIVTPSSIVFLVIKLRIVPPLTEPVKDELDVDETKEELEKDRIFLEGSSTAEDVVSNDDSSLWAHAPHWPGNRIPSWWLLLADEKQNRLAIPPVKITDVPMSGTLKGNRDYRTYKVQFQAPASVGDLTWKLYLISDTFVGEEAYKNITLKVEDFSALNDDEQDSEDEISEPDEDTLAGQMAVMRGGKAKKVDDEDDDESSTDDDEDSSDSSSDSDSD